MRIATHAIHTGYDYEFAKLGHEVFSVQSTWHDGFRPKPGNWHLVANTQVPQCDLGVVGSWTGFEWLKHHKFPMIFNFLSDGSEGSFPQHVEERVSRIVFLGKEVADRWQLQDPSKKVVIELGLDTEHFSGYRGESGVVLTVGNLLPDRWEKGYMPYRTLCRLMPLTLVGDGNQGLPGAIGSISYEALLDRYRNSSVYFNPGCVIGISVAEAMAVGMPVVTMRPINLCDLIQDGVNGFVVDTVDGAAAKVRLLLGNPTLRQTISLAARETAQRRFGLEVFRREWNRLFSSVLREQE